MPSCQCADKLCPVHTGQSSCNRPMFETLYRVDMSDDTGTDFCEGSSQDAMDSGRFVGGHEADQDTEEEDEDRPDASCDQCQALMIQGHYCHETGCPNTHKVKVDGQWIRPEPEEED